MSRLNRDYNPFANIDLHLPVAFMDAVRRYCRTQGAEKDGEFESVPFNRIVDLWALSIATGFADEMPIPLDREQSHKFHTGQVIQGNLELIELLHLVAIAHTNDPFIVRDSRRVIAIADSYAAGGLPTILRSLDEGLSAPATNVTRDLLRRIPGVQATA